MKPKPIQIDRRAAVRRFGNDCVSATAEPRDYAERIAALISCHYSYGRKKMLATARRTSTSDRRKAFAEVTSA
jgi:hypothetical protein